VKRQIRIKQDPIFRKRIIITLPPWGVPIVAAAAGIALGVQLEFLYIVIMTILVFIAFLGVAVEHRMVKELRYQIHNILYDIENEDMTPAAAFKDFIAEKPEPVQRISVKANGNGIPKRS
jgi:Mg2+/citrate symporter